MKPTFFRALLLLAVSAIAHAHFVFVSADPGNASVRIMMSENLQPDVDVNIIAGTKLTLRTPGSPDAPIAMVRADKAFFTAQTAGNGTRVIFGISDLGLMSRGKPHILIYYPKTILGDPFAAQTQLGDAAPVEIIPQGKPGKVVLKLVAHGKPVADGEITLILTNGEEKKLKTNAEGLTEVIPETGRLAAWARFWEAKPGERDGKKYEELRNYATLVADVPNVAASISKMPQATASFGSAVEGDWLYVYGGHVSPTHTYFKEAVTGRFDRMRLTGEPVWESLPAGSPSQGLNLAAYQGRVFRVGGMQPRNEKSKPADNHSLAEVAAYNTKTGNWEALPQLPEARSSHDVVVIGGKLIIVGGWNMKGKDPSVWANTLNILDLSSAKPEWKEVPQPFERRALMAAAYEGKMYVIGGIDPKNQVLRAVSIFDPVTSTWTEGPELPKGPLLGFAPAAGLHQGRLYVSVGDGTLLRLSANGKEWEIAGASSPRIAHRLASRGNDILLVGGASKGHNSDFVEAVRVQ